MDAILQQLGLDQTFFIQFGIFAILFAIVSQLFFSPFLGLFEYRERRTVQDRQAAEKLMSEAEAKFEAYRAKVAEERIAARKSLESFILEAKKEEAALLSNARAEAKRISQEALDSLDQQREQIRAKLQGDVESLAKTVSEVLLSQK